MRDRFRVKVDVLEWILGRSPADGSREPFRVKDIEPDGSQVWLELDRIEDLENAVLTRVAPHHVPDANRERALALRKLLHEAPPEVSPNRFVIGMALSSNFPLSFQAIVHRANVSIPKRFKERPKKRR